MKQTRDFPAARVSKRAEATIKAGHPWVYDNEITDMPEGCANGCLIDAVSEKGAYLGTGLLSLNSKIRIRILSSNANERFGPEFFRRRVKYALDYRRTVMRDDFGCCRLIFGEADALPGMTMDRYGGILVSQVLSYGMELVRDEIYSAVVDELRAGGETVDGLYERDDVAIRGLEGLDERKAWYSCGYLGVPPSPITEITENGIVYSVDVENGQKTGFFLDQKYNRLAVAKLSRGMRVLDCFTHTGSFALNAAMGGAEHVTAVDVSASAVEMARANAARNGLDARMDFVCADVFELLPELCEKRAPYDLIILDPPAFTKSRKTVSGAERGYKEINFRAMKLLPRGGYLATCSCSHFMEDALFRKMLLSAASDAGVTLRLIECRRQAPDHPVLMGVPETDYLKFYLFQIV